jgi:hypothetical protein
MSSTSLGTFNQCSEALLESQSLKVDDNSIGIERNRKIGGSGLCVVKGAACDSRTSLRNWEGGWRRLRLRVAPATASSAQAARGSASCLQHCPDILAIAFSPSQNHLFLPSERSNGFIRKGIAASGACHCHRSALYQTSILTNGPAVHMPYPPDRTGC